MGDCSMEGDAIILSVEHMPILMVMTEMAWTSMLVPCFWGAKRPCKMDGLHLKATRPHWPTNQSFYSNT